MLNKFKQMLGIKQYPGMPLIPELSKQAKVNIAEMSRLLGEMYDRVAELEDLRVPYKTQMIELYSLKAEIILLRHTLERYAYDEAVRIVSRNVPIEKPTEPVLEIHSNGVDGMGNNLDGTGQLQEAAEIGELGELTLPILGRVGEHDVPIRARVGNDDKPSLKFGAGVTKKRR